MVLLLAALVACHRGAPSNEAIRQGVIDYLAKKGLNVQGMDLAVTSVERNGSDANATVTLSPKGQPAQLMAFKYHMQQHDNAWVVVGSAESGAPHGGMAPPETGNSHGGPPPGAAPGGADKMPDPSALPPSSPKK